MGAFQRGLLRTTRAGPMFGVAWPRASAEAFGLLPMRLERDHDRLVLLTAQTGVELGEAYDENITVFRLKAGVDVATPRRPWARCSGAPASLD